MSAAKMPWTWAQWEKETGRELPGEAQRRVTACFTDPTSFTWTRARSVVIAPHMSEMGQTLWQCTEAVTMRRWADSEVPARRDIEMALCYALGVPFPARRTR